MKVLAVWAWVCAGVALGLAGGCAAAQEMPPELKDKVDAAIEQAMTKTGVPSASFGAGKSSTRRRLGMRACPMDTGRRS